MPQNYLKEIKKPDQKVNPLFAYLNIIVEEIGPEKAVLRLPLKHDFIQGAQVIAGGIVSTLADETMAHVVIANLEKGQDTATIEMNVRYMKAVVKGELTCVGKIVKKGRRVFFVEADVSDADGKLVARAGASFMVIDKK